MQTLQRQHTEAKMQRENVQAKTKHHNINERHQPEGGHRHLPGQGDRGAIRTQGGGRQTARVSKGCINWDNHGSHPRKTTRAKGSSRTTPFTTAAAEESCTRHHDNSKPENNQRGGLVPYEITSNSEQDAKINASHTAGQRKSSGRATTQTTINQVPT